MGDVRDDEHELGEPFGELSEDVRGPGAILDLELEAERIVVALEPPATGPVLHQMHAWQVRLSAPDGSPVSQAEVSFAGGMPQHGHGFPTKPRVTRELRPGVYALEGMKFSMTGWWDMRLTSQSGGVTDEAVFNVIVDESGIRR